MRPENDLGVVMGILSSSLSAAWLRVVALLASVALAAVGMVVAAPVARADGLPPTLTTDLPDYNPGATVTLGGAHWVPGQPVHIRVDDNVGAGWYLDSDPDPVAGGDGTLEYQFRLPFDVIALYTAVATQTQADGTVLKASVTFTDAAGGNLDQCANGKVTTPPTNPLDCTGAQWQNGNLNEQNSQWVEGDSVPYRLVLTGLPTTPTSHTVTIGWDLTEGGNWAYDYLTSYNRTNTQANPCSGVTGCNSTAIPVNIPTDNFVKSVNNKPTFSQIPGVISAFKKGTTTSLTGLTAQYVDDPAVGPLTPADVQGTSERRIQFSFTTDSDTVVLAWAGHIATRADWGSDTAVADINGSPYHMRFIDLNGKGGNQDRSLKASAVIFPAQIIIKKVTSPSGATQSFSFTGSSPFVPASFNLQDGQSSTPYVTKLFQPYTITEGTASGWTLTGVTCTTEFGNGGTQTVSLPNRNVAIDLKEGEYVTCTFNNQANPKALTVSKTFTPTYTRTYSYGITKDVDKTSVSIADGGTATFNYTVNATKSFVDSQFGGSGKITVNNPNAGDVTGVTVTDTTTNGVSCTVTNGTNVTVPGNGSVVLDYSCTPAVTKPADGTNTATASWSTQTVNGVSLPGGSAKGDAAMSWSGAPTTIENQSVTVKDDQATATTSDDVTLGTMSYTDPSPKSFTYSLSFKGVGGTCTDYTNTASLSSGPTASKKVTVCVGKDLSVSKTVTPTFGRAYTWNIQKGVDKTEFLTSAGSQVTANYVVKVTNSAQDSAFQLKGTITVTNPNDWQDVVVNISDAADAGQALCTIDGAGGSNITVPKRANGADGSVSVNYTCTLASANALTTGTNTATATWNKDTYKTPTGSATGTAPYTFVGVTPSITNGTITVLDDKTTGTPVELGTASYTDTMPKEFAYSVKFTAPQGTCATYDNTASIKENGKTAKASVTVCGALPLTAFKLGSGSYDSVYTWDIDKVAGAKQTVPAGTSPIKVSYTVTVTQTGYSESGATAAGTITISNPNNWQAVDVAVSDSMGAGSTCLVEGVPTKQVTAPASGGVTVEWSCTFASVPATKTVKNVASITWDKAKAYTTTGSTTAEADITFALGTATDATVTVTDTFNGGAPVELEQVTGVASSSSADWFTKLYPLSYEVTPKAATCTTYPNKASITGIDEAQATAEVCVAKDLTVSKTGAGSYDERYFWQITKKAAPASQTVPAGTTATIDYEVAASQTGYQQTGGVASGVVTIKNPNDFQAVTVNLADTLPGATCAFSQSGVGITGTAITVAKSGTVTVDYTCTYGSVPEGKTVTNTATISWDKAAAKTPNGSAQGTAEFELLLDQSTDKTITVKDVFNGGSAQTKGTLQGVPAFASALWASDSWTYSQQVTAPDGTCAEYKNTASIYGDGGTLLGSAKAAATVCGAKDLTISKTAAGTYDRSATWEITKSATPTDSVVPAGSGQKVDYSVTVTQKSYSETDAKVSGEITVTNPNKFGGPLDLTVTDSLGVQGATCAISENGVLLVGGKASIGQDVSKTFTYVCTYLFVPEVKDQTNSATVSWDKAQMNSAKSSATVDKQFTLALGKSTNIDITVTDTYDGTTVTLGSLTAKTDGSATATYTYSHTITPDAGKCLTKDNTAKIVETGQTASASAKVCAAADLTVSKTAVPSFKRTYNWTISKSVTPTTVVQIPAGTATFNYTVVATQTGYTDSLWQVSGKITVTNPNTFQAVTADVTDSLPGASCTVTGGDDVSVPAGSAVIVDYVCTFGSSQTGATVTNTATATWDKATYGTPSGTASGTKDATFTSPTTSVNKTITVKDTWDGSTTTLGTATATDAPPYTWKTFTYSKSVTAPAAGVCVTKNNTAVIVETGQSASQTVTVCGPDKLGSRTIGFWQNKNGQGIIKAGATLDGVCKSGTWLRQYNPYKDLSTTADCAAVATYVWNVIKAASSAGTTMNPMLKAQMLATALDVYFSDPALGGNKLGAPKPIGPRVIDLTKICKYTGTSCSGSLYDVSSAFGGSPKTVLQMLAYASSQSSSGGSLWYSNIKSTQEKAKNAFDAINNDQVLVIG